MQTKSSITSALARGSYSIPRYFVSTKRGWRRYVPPRGGDVPFVVLLRGRWRVVHRAESDAEFFAAHPDALYRATACRIFHREFFALNIVVRDGALSGYSDNYDLVSKLWRDDIFHLGGSLRERVQAGIRALLNDQHRYS